MGDLCAGGARVWSSVSLVAAENSGHTTASRRELQPGDPPGPIHSLQREASPPMGAKGTALLLVPTAVPSGTTVAHLAALVG